MPPTSYTEPMVNKFERQTFTILDGKKYTMYKRMISQPYRTVNHYHKQESHSRVTPLGNNNGT